MLKKLPLAIILITSLAGSAQAQITITSADLPVANDTFRISNGLITPAIDPIPTGPNHTWDFSMLEYTSQDVDSFHTVASTGATYSFIFADLPFNNNRSNQAHKGMNLPAIPLGGVTITDMVNFFYKSSSVYHQTGSGATINGIGVPIPYTDKDRVFSLPLNFSDTDSCYSSYQISIPNLGYYGHEQTRISEVDGWGTLITPYGSFNTLRVKSVITPYDTIYADSLGFGMGFALPPTVEYKWMGALQGIPLLQINTTLDPFGGGEVVNSIVYRDSIRTTTGIGETPITPVSLTFDLYPNPSTGIFTLEFSSPVNQAASVELYSTEGKKVAELWKGDLNQGVNKLFINTNLRMVAAGSYFISATAGNETFRKKLIIASPE